MAAGRGATAQPCEHRVDDRLPQHRAGIAGASRLAPSRRARHQPPAQHACVTRLRTIPPRNVRRETDTRPCPSPVRRFSFLSSAVRLLKPCQDSTIRHPEKCGYDTILTRKYRREMRCAFPRPISWRLSAVFCFLCMSLTFSVVCGFYISCRIFRPSNTVRNTSKTVNLDPQDSQSWLAK